MMLASRDVLLVVKVVLKCSAFLELAAGNLKVASQLPQDRDGDGCDSGAGGDAGGTRILYLDELVVENAKYAKVKEVLAIRDA